MNTSTYAGIAGIPEWNDDEFDGLARCRNV